MYTLYWELSHEEGARIGRMSISDGSSGQAAVSTNSYTPDLPKRKTQGGKLPLKDKLYHFSFMKIR